MFMLLPLVYKICDLVSALCQQTVLLTAWLHVCLVSRIMIEANSAIKRTVQYNYSDENMPCPFCAMGCPAGLIPGKQELSKRFREMSLKYHPDKQRSPTYAADLQVFVNCCNDFATKVLEGKCDYLCEYGFHVRGFPANETLAATQSQTYTQMGRT